MSASFKSEACGALCTPRKALGCTSFNLTDYLQIAKFCFNVILLLITLTSIPISNHICAYKVLTWCMTRLVLARKG